MLPGGTFAGGEREFWIGERIRPSIAAIIRIFRASAEGISMWESRVSVK